MRRSLYVIALLLGASSVCYGDLDGILTYPGGSDGGVQYNCDYLFCSEAGFSYNSTTNLLSVSSVTASFASISTAAVTQIRWANGTIQVSSPTAGAGSSGVNEGDPLGSASANNALMYTDGSGHFKTNSGLTFNGTTVTVAGITASTIAVVSQIRWANGTIQVSSPSASGGSSGVTEGDSLASATSNNAPMFTNGSGKFTTASGLQFNGTSTLTVGDSSDDAKPGIVTIKSYDGLGGTGSPTLNVFGTATTESGRINFDNDDAGGSINASIRLGPSSLFSGSCASGELCLASDGSVSSGPSLRFGSKNMLNLAGTGVSIATHTSITGNITVSSLTSGRVPYASTSGLLIDSTALTFDGTNLASTNQILGKTSGACSAGNIAFAASGDTTTGLSIASGQATLCEGGSAFATMTGVSNKNFTVNANGNGNSTGLSINGSNDGFSQGTGLLNIHANGSKVMRVNGSAWGVKIVASGATISDPVSTLDVGGSFSLAYLSTAPATASTYTLTSSDYMVTVDASTGPREVDLPTSVGITGRMYSIKKIDASANAVTIDANGSQTIDGATTYVLDDQWDVVTIISNNVNWLILSRVAAD